MQSDNSICCPFTESVSTIEIFDEAVRMCGMSDSVHFHKAGLGGSVRCTSD